jgi:hypothetical protein
MSTNNGNFIRPGKHGSQVVLDPDFLLCHALYMPESNRRQVVHDSRTGSSLRTSRQGCSLGRQIANGDRIQGWQCGCLRIVDDFLSQKLEILFHF